MLFFLWIGIASLSTAIGLEFIKGPVPPD